MDFEKLYWKNKYKHILLILDYYLVSTKIKTVNKPINVFMSWQFSWTINIKKNFIILLLPGKIRIFAMLCDNSYNNNKKIGNDY